MKVKLEFDLPEENSGFLLAQRGSDYFSALWRLDQETRSFLKHGHTFKTPDEVLEWLSTQIPYNLFEGID